MVLSAIVLIIIGSACVGAALYVEQNHKEIWRHSLHTFRKHGEMRDWLTGPSKTMYKVNVFVLWPAVFLLGIAAVAVGLGLLFL